jgi:hypothetical protein
MIGPAAMALWSTRRVRCVVRLADHHEAALLAAGWRMTTLAPPRWQCPTSGREMAPASAWRAHVGDVARDGAA